MRIHHVGAAVLGALAQLSCSSSYAFVSPLTDGLGLAEVEAGNPWSTRNVRFAKHIVVGSGQTVRADTFYSLAPDCTQSGWPQMQIRYAPVAGQVWDEHGMGTPGYPKRDVRHLCNGSRRPGDVVYYRAPAGFHGHDHFTVWEIFPDSRGAQKSIDVEVR